MNVAIIDNNSENLSKAKSILGSLAKSNEKTETYHMDVSQLSEWQKVKTDFESKFKSLDFLMLNAGTVFRTSGDGKGKVWEEVDVYRKLRFTSSDYCNHNQRSEP